MDARASLERVIRKGDGAGGRRTDTDRVRRFGVTAAGLLLVGVGLATSGRAEPVRSIHTCSATDRQFLRVAASNVETVQLMGQSYVSGDGDAASVVAAARNAALGMERTAPRDVALKRARVFVHGMFTEYGRAIRAREQGRDAAGHMYRAYSLANFAHAAIDGARPGLTGAGCQISALL
jgi:hypothetical protein